MPRLFSAIPIPPDILEGLSKIKSPLPSTRWIDPADMHLTLRFIGDVTPPVAREFADNLAQITFDPFSLRLTGLDTFGGNHPKSIHATVEPSDALADLAHANEIAARRAGLPPLKRKYVPHVTIARLDTPRVPPLVRFLEHHGGFRSPPFLVTEYNLISAKPFTGGGPYVTEESFASSLGILDQVNNNFTEEQ